MDSIATEAYDLDEEPVELSYAAQVLLEGYRKMPKPAFAVMDGAGFYDLKAKLSDENIYCRSLFLDHADEAIERAGGWLVPVEDDAALMKMLQLPGAAESMVFWSCPLGEPALHRHLRSLNVVIIPNDETPPEQASTGEGDTEAEFAKEQSVMFRHYDPEVVNSLLPLMTAAQYARFFGPATQFMWYSSQYNNRRRTSPPDDLPVAPHGPLRFTAEQIAELEESREHNSVQIIMRFLRKVDAKHADTMSDEELRQFVCHYMDDGRSLGMRGERALGYWAYLNLHSGGSLSRDQSFRDFMLRDKKFGSPDDKMYTLMQRLSEQAD
ncbi:DUF4123 domain-containing protein [Rhizobium paknamense]|uniref:DUF4123 domain-containing protein n=1 Tax=Rhizobium paknamense TaxID=1206817 RepID=A0ABU0IKT9_9HYPH|nr:DUF4123 domain-containing protein [Rhizobium paknamense]MDQ0458228.1 hypothetical protein [Rhizobium paknamense]